MSVTFFSRHLVCPHPSLPPSRCFRFAPFQERLTARRDAVLGVESAVRDVAALNQMFSTAVLAQVRARSRTRVLGRGNGRAVRGDGWDVIGEATAAAAQ